jgi:hypothetical protein
MNFGAPWKRDDACLSLTRSVHLDVTDLNQGGIAARQAFFVL